MNLQFPKWLFPSQKDGVSLSSTLQHFSPILAITILGLVLRLMKIDSSFWYDEGFTGYLTRLSLGDALHSLTKEDIQSPLYYLIVWFWAKIFPTDWGMHLFSVLTGVISIPVLFSLSSKLFNRQIGLLASLFLALSPYHLIFSNDARPYSLYVFLSIVALWFVVKALESKKHCNWWWLCYSFTAALMLYTHHVGSITFIGMIAFHFCLIWPMDRRHFIQWIGFNILPVMLFLPWIPVVLPQLKMSKDLLVWIPQINPRFFIKTMIRYIYYIPYDRPSLIVISLWIMPHLLLLGLAMLITESVSKKRIIAVTSFAAFPIAVITVYSYFVRPIFATRYLSPVVVALMILPAIPVVLLKKTRWHGVICLITALALMLSFASCLNFLKLPRTVNWRGAAHEIKQNTQDDDVILVFPPGAINVFNFYFQDNTGTKVLTLNTSVDLDSLSFEFLKGFRRLWIIRNKALGKKGASNQVVNWFDQKYNIIMRDDKFKFLEIIMVNLEPKPEPTISE
ncbi:MAG: hypothetical protein GY845_14215 [Planctomycetes bacterium]|nr:hypothetical protein [Planctomycetota bacterium]